ncbi:uncharacterized protein [Eurosta solidaginis]|uniref:uncharacterized protein isoform X3 n=1 Tax=Eurosta solidaginis TaxID=178769 RepID=UPI0035305D30
MHSIQRSCKMGRLLYAIIFALLVISFDTVQADDTFTSYLDGGNECGNLKTNLEAIANNEKANFQTIDNFNTAIQQLTGRITQLQNDIEDLSKRSCTVQQGALNAKCEI